MDFWDRFIYRPSTLPYGDGFDPTDLDFGCERAIFRSAEETTLTGWYVSAPEARHALLYCHGNAGDYRDWVYAAEPWAMRGFDCLVFDYRGYGQSEGSPSEAGLYLDTEAAWLWLAERAGQKGLQASLLGKSLGSAVAIHVAVKYVPTSLVLDSAFTSMREVIAARLPRIFRFVVPRRFESLAKVGRIACPTLIIHGTDDKLVPVCHAHTLLNRMRCSKTLRLVQGAGHNDITDYYCYDDWIADFLAAQLAFSRTYNGCSLIDTGLMSDDDST